MGTGGNPSLKRKRRKITEPLPLFRDHHAKKHDFKTYASA